MRIPLRPTTWMGKSLWLLGWPSHQSTILSLHLHQGTNLTLVSPHLLLSPGTSPIPRSLYNQLQLRSIMRRVLRPPPVSTSGNNSPPSSSGGPTFRTIHGNLMKHDKTVNRTNISSFNTERNAIKNSFNNNSLVESSGNHSCQYLSYNTLKLTL